MSHRAQTAFAALLLVLGLAFPACESAGSEASPAPDTQFDTQSDIQSDIQAGDTAEDTAQPQDIEEDLTEDTAGDTAQPQDAAEDTVGGGTFACGAKLTCQAGQACASRGQGVCGGPPPDANGQCEPDCFAMDCGGSTHCLCATYWCEDLPAGCASCDCAVPPDASCVCSDTGGAVQFDCPGA